MKQEFAIVFLQKNCNKFQTNAIAWTSQKIVAKNGTFTIHLLIKLSKTSFAKILNLLFHKFVDM